MHQHFLGSPREPRRVSRLIVAPHADDEVLGCGGLLAKYPEDSAVVVLAQLDADRAVEFRDAQKVLGYQDSYFLNLRDGSVGYDMHGLVGLLDEVLNRCRPDELFLPYPSMHQDHVAAYEAGMRAARLSMTQDHWYPPTVLVYDVAAYDLSLYPTELRWNIFESLTESEVDQKARAVLAYKSQFVAGPHPVNGIKQCAQALGSARQVEWAEQYALVRSVRRGPVRGPAAISPAALIAQPVVNGAAVNGAAVNGAAVNGAAVNGSVPNGAKVVPAGVLK